MLSARGIPAVIPEKSDQIAAQKRDGPKRGRPPVSDEDAYKERNVVERPFPSSISRAASRPVKTSSPSPTAPPQSSTPPSPGRSYSETRPSPRQQAARLSFETAVKGRSEDLGTSCRHAIRVGSRSDEFPPHDPSSCYCQSGTRRRDPFRGQNGSDEGAREPFQVYRTVVVQPLDLQAVDNGDEERGQIERRESGR